ncbi:hypothetical protein AB6735_27190 [Mucilaginibacter sp. RCC_168]|uniref:hypothetical protein n=1 Tax=Mucilaginibacter sp. RCC_168 TaxID=3239221 RepID=UPI003523A983
MAITKRTKVKIKKVISLFVLFTLLNQMFAPMVAYALTAGPTAPEATNFEPIDTTDMVNPLTGSFTYGVPLLEVPGPEGGYPLALSYHAGIQPNEEASWVGLGWSLNPGAITRNVNGYPDDWSAASGAGGTMSNRWAGGSQSTYSVGVNIGLAGSPASVSAGLSFSSDTYRGFGVGMSFGIGPNLGDKSPLSFGVQVGVSPYGGGYVGANLNYNAGAIGNSGLRSSLGIAAQTNFQSVSGTLNGGVNSSSGSMVGASISTSDIKPSFSVGGGAITSVNDVDKGKISTSSDGFFFGIPIYPGVSIGLGYQNIRYWSSTSNDFTANGVLNNHSSIGSVTELNTTDDDNYSLLDPNLSIVDNPEPRGQLGGTYPNFDNYSVTGQGLGGNIRPYAFSTVLFNQNRINNTDHPHDIYGEAVASNITPATLGKKWQFRFINDLSNSYRQGQPWSTDQTYNFDGNPQYGNNDGGYGYDASTNRLEGTNHIEYFTNAQIIDKTAAGRGFIDCDQAAGFDRANINLPNQIGGFMITNASGVTYHYALPAYSRQEVAYTQSKDGTTSNTLNKNTPYAYTWYLTAITGPDYVSRGSTLGNIDKGDWGYWVKFDYGMFTNIYKWRNPTEGYQADIDSQFVSYSSGTKELYYLDAIETRTHTALFVKERRLDGKSIGSFNDFGVTNSGFNEFSENTLGLSYILLMKNDQLLSSLSTIRNASNGITDGYISKNVVDINDVSSLTENIIPKTIRKIKLIHDYSLVPGTTNSFDANNVTAKSGKYSLLSIDFQGKGGSSITPPIQFQYDLDSADPANNDNITITNAVANQAGINQPGTIRVGTLGRFKTGDIITFTINGTSYYCTLVSTADNSNFNVLFLNNSPGTGSNNTTQAARKTKNPPYNVDACDNWLCYKSDYVANNDNVKLSRMTSQVSNMATDVWSMRKIVSGLGSNININYEGNSYNKSILTKNRSIILLPGAANTTRNSTANYTFTVAPGSPDLTALFKVGDKTSMIYMMYRYANSQLATVNTDAQSKTPLIVTAVTPNKIAINVSAEMDQDISSYIDGFQTANMITNGGNLIYGGGIRVKDLIVNDLNGNITKTSYDYSMPNYPAGQTSSSGVTAYEPYIFDPDNLVAVRTRSGDANYSTDVLEKPYRRELYKLGNKILAISRELPSPGVTYEYVTVRDYNILSNGASVPINGKTTYQYQVFKPEMIGIYDYNDLKGVQPASGSGPTISSSNQVVTGLTGQAKKDRTIKDYTSRIGNLKRVITYDNLGNKLTEKINHYLYDDLDNTTFQNQMDNYEPRLAAYNGVTYNNMGVIKERYGNSRFIVNSFQQVASISVYQGSSFLMMSNKETFPSIQTGTTQIDYKNGTRMDQTNLAYDYYTGAVIKTLTTDSYGNRFVNQVTPAYMAGYGTTYPALGLKTHDDVPGAVQHKQMLTQQASNYTFSVDNNNTPIGVVTASVQTWSNAVPVLDPNENTVTDSSQSNIWRIEKSLSWLAPGSSATNLIPYDSFVDYFYPGARGPNFNFPPGNTNPAWKTTSQITQYNVYSAALEARDINTNYAATRMGHNSSKVLITGSPARYNEIAYAGAEDVLLSNGNFSNNITKGSGTVVVDSTNAHTGMSSLKVTAGANGFTYNVPISKLAPNQSYHVAVWVKPATGTSFNQAQLYYTANGSTVTPTQTYSKTAANWCLLEMTVPATAIAGTTLAVGCKNASATDMYFDDFRFQPISASATAFVYDNQTGELIYILDNNNLFTRYQYDAIGRLVRTYREVLGKTKAPIVNAVRYHYQRNGNLN